MCASKPAERDTPSTRDCPLCGVLSGKLPGHIIRLTRQTATIVTLEGHAAIMPRAHMSVGQGDNRIDSALGRETLRAARRLRQVEGVEGVNIFVALGKAAGQEVDHTHIHVIPRRTGDNLGKWPRNHPRLPSEERAIIARDLRRILS